MRQRAIRISGYLLTLFSLITLMAVSTYGQQADLHRQAASRFRQAASQTSGAQRACYLEWASYEECQASRFGSGGASNCSKPTCSLEASPKGASSADNNRAINSSAGSSSAIDESFTALRNTVIGIFAESNRRRAERERVEAEEQAREEAAANEKRAREDAEMEEIAARRRAGRSTEENEEDARARERARAYKAQKARERNMASVQTSRVCGWQGIAVFDDVPNFSGAQSNIPAGSPLLLRIFTIAKNGSITGTINGLPFTGSVNPDRGIWIVRGDPTVDWDELRGQFSEDARTIKGRWVNVTLNKRSRGEFSLQEECK